MLPSLKIFWSPNQRCPLSVLSIMWLIYCHHSTSCLNCLCSCMCLYFSLIVLLLSQSVMSDSLRPMDCSLPGFPVPHHLLKTLLKLMSIESAMPSDHLILCHPLLFLPSIFPSIGVFSNESALCFRWPKYWSFSFSISPWLSASY